MSLRCLFGIHDTYHPRPNTAGRLVATCRRCDRELAIDLTNDVGRTRVTQSGKPEQLRLVPRLRIVRRKAR